MCPPSTNNAKPPRAAASNGPREGSPATEPSTAGVARRTRGCTKTRTRTMGRHWRGLADATVPVELQDTAEGGEHGDLSGDGAAWGAFDGGKVPQVSISCNHPGDWQKFTNSRTVFQENTWMYETMGREDVEVAKKMDAEEKK